MQVEDFFEWLGRAIGGTIRLIVDLLLSFLNFFVIAGHSFLEGLSSALGINRSFLSLLTLIVGLLLLGAAIKAFTRRSVVPGLLWLLLGLWILSWLLP